MSVVLQRKLNELNRAILLSLLLAILVSPAIHAEKNKNDTSQIYIRKFHEYWYIKGISTQKTFSIGFEDKNLPGEKMTYKPNLGHYLGFGLFVFDIGIDVSFRTPPNAEQNALYGNSKGQDWQFHIYTRQVGIDISYQEYTGFYLENPDDFYPSWETGDPYPRKSEMKARNISLGGVYVFNNNKYSFPSIFNHTESQQKSAGSFLLSSQFILSDLSDPISIIPEVDSNQFTSLDGLNKINATSINILPGYSHNFIIKSKFYISLSLALGLGYQIRSYSTHEDSYRNNAIGLANTWRIGAGYNGRRLFLGISGYAQKNEVTIQDLKVSTESGFVRVFLGYRFREWGIMRKSVFDLF